MKALLVSVVLVVGVGNVVISTHAQQVLQSKLFEGDAALNAASVSDQAHVTPGARGLHVGKIQNALMQLDRAIIDPVEIQQGFYGPSTATAVLEYKRRRGIINPNYQTQADNIVGKMTIARLDREMKERESQSPPPPPPVKPPEDPNLPILPTTWERGVWSPDKSFSGGSLIPSLGCTKKWYCNARTDMMIGGDERIETTPPEVMNGQCLAGTGSPDSCNSCITPPPQKQCLFRIVKK